ncbi:MAG: thioredoxin [Armatimonadetes bacterium]|nr:thioredoxin [Armatimonadota bacterium]
MANAVKETTAEQFETMVSTSVQPVLVDFWAPWCLPCHMMAPVLEQVADKFRGKVEVLKVNVDEAPEIADRYGIRGIPTLILFSGGTEVGRQIGFMAPAQLEAWLSRYVA